jgi:hypothetical protein
MKKIHFKYSEEDIIKGNLGLQTIQRSLRSYGILNPTFEVVTSQNFLKNVYDNWNEEKRKGFINLLGGRVQFKKIKNYIESIERKKQYEKTV